MTEAELILSAIVDLTRVVARIADALESRGAPKETGKQETGKQDYSKYAQRSADRRKLGLCSRCGKPAKPFNLCVGCRKAARDRRDAMRRERQTKREQARLETQECDPHTT